MAPNDDVTTAIGTCSGSYDRLLTLRQRRQNCCNQSLPQQQQQQQQQHVLHKKWDDTAIKTCDTTQMEADVLADGNQTTSQRRRRNSWIHRSKQTFLVMVFMALTCLGRITLTTAQGSMRFVVQPENKTVAEGGTVVMNCVIENLKGRVTWTQEGFALGITREMENFPRYAMLGSKQGNREEFNLQVLDVNLEDDEGHYECQVQPSSESQGMRSRKAYLTVVVPPERPAILNGTTIPVVLNRPSQIMCSANNGKPAPSITWHISGERMTQNVSMVTAPHEKRINATGILTLTANMGHNGKRIECQAYQQFMRTPFRTVATLDVQYPPNLTMSVNITSRTLREYDYVRLQCFGLANPPISSWKWYKDGVQLPNITTNTYNIPAIGRKFNNVVISCEASNGVGSSRLEKRLNVEYGPNITDITEVVGADVGGQAELRCHVDGNPTPSVIWRRKDRSRKSHHMLSTKNVYNIDRVTDASFGWYVCTAAVIGFPDTSKEVMVLKNDRPSPRSEKRQMAVKGEPGKIACLVTSIPKPKSVLWSKGKKEIDLTRSGRFKVEEIDMLFGVKNTLLIRSVQSGDFGFYNCTVENEYGTSFDEIELVEKYTLPITYIIIGIIGGFAVIFVIVLVCVLYRRYKREDQGSVLGSYTDTDSSSDKKREKADSPSTLMGQFRQGYTKDVYRFSADYDDMPYKEQTKGNNNGYGFIEPYESYSDHPIYDGEYVHGGDEPIPSDRFDSLYSTGTGTGFNMSSFRANNFDTTPPPTMTRITPLHMNSSKLATDV